ncbi:MAG: stalk domain-containing protein [Clostridia bacterium]|nr:stalk domain-containing protein [Clostridia bacterium]
MAFIRQHRTKLSQLFATLFIIFTLFSVHIPFAHAEGKTTLTVHYHRSSNDYDGWNLWLWNIGESGSEYKFTEKDSFGQKATVELPFETKRLGLILRKGNWESKDGEEDKFIDISNGKAEIWLIGGDNNIYNKNQVISLQIGNAYMNIDGTEKEIDPGRGTAPQIINGRTLVPITSIVNALGGSLSWNGTEKKISITLESNQIELQIGNKAAYVNKTLKKLDVAPQVVNSRTMLPLAFVAENLGCIINWNSQTKQIILNKPYYTEGEHIVRDITFKYYSSYAKEVYLSGTFNGWAPFGKKMIKDGNWFSATLPIKDYAEYLFYVDGQWYRDPYCPITAGAMQGSVIDLRTSDVSTNISTNIKVFTSEHFDYFTSNGIDKTAELEAIYKTLSDSLLSFFDAKINKPKIHYYAMKYNSDEFPYAIYETSEIYDLLDCSSSHEVIHDLVYIKNSAFTEGMAQCFQKEGNSTYKEQNVSLASKYILTKNGNIDLLSTIQKYTASRPDSDTYREMGSYNYYNIFILNKPSEFAKFLKSLEFTDSIDDIKSKYRKAMGKELENTIND